MSLRKSPTLTPKMLAANSRNARRSTGPTTALGFAGEDTRGPTEGPTTAPGFAMRTPAPRYRSRLCAVRGSMLALGENAEEFDRVYREAHGAQAAPWLPTAGFGAEVQHSYSQQEKEERSRNVL